MMKERLPNGTTTQDEDEIGAYCVTAVRDFTSLLTKEMGGMVGTWIRGVTPHDNGPTGGLAAQRPATRTVHEYLPISKEWSVEKLAANNVTADGLNSYCVMSRAPRAGHDDSGRYYRLVDRPVGALRECEGLCTEHAPSCYAIQFQVAAQRCELWAHCPQVTGWRRGAMCLRRVSRELPA